MPCRMCEDYQEGQLWVDHVITGRRTPDACAKHFNMHVDDVLIHIYDHVVLGEAPTPSDSHSIVAEVVGHDGLVSIDYYTNEMMSIISHIKRWVRNLNLRNSSSSADIKLGIQLMREFRLTLESVAEFQGRIESRKTTSTINIESMNKRLLELTYAIRTEVCPECRKKLLEIITREDNQSQIITIIPETTSNTCPPSHGDTTTRSGL